MNKKGFAATGILYTILVLFILLFSGMLTMLYSRNNILIQIQNEIKGNIYKDVTLNIKGTEYTESIASQVDFDITGIDISDVTNIGCNNGAEVTVEGNHVVVSKVLGGTICKMNTSLATTASELDNTRNYILMLKDETLTSENAEDTKVVFAENTNVELNLNAHQLNTSKILVTNGDLVIKGDENSKIVSTTQVLNNSATGTITINGGYYERTTGTGAAIYNQGTGVINLNNCDVLSSGVSVQNGVGTGTTAGIININSGNYISLANRTILNFLGTININQTDKPIYIKTESKAWAPAIYNSSTGTINITGKQANECTSNPSDTTSGLCIYSGAFDETDINNKSNGAIQNNKGTININGGTYYGAWQGINNNSTGIINITGNTKIISRRYIILNKTGTINICKMNSELNNIVDNVSGDLVINSTGTINYSTDVIFSSGTNIPKIHQNYGTINSNYTGTCIK